MDAYVLAQWAITRFIMLTLNMFDSFTQQLFLIYVSRFNVIKHYCAISLPIIMSIVLKLSPTSLSAVFTLLSDVVIV